MVLNINMYIHVQYGSTGPQTRKLFHINYYRKFSNYTYLHIVHNHCTVFTITFIHYSFESCSIVILQCPVWQACNTQWVWHRKLLQSKLSMTSKLDAPVHNHSKIYSQTVNNNNNYYIIYE